MSRVVRANKVTIRTAPTRAAIAKSAALAAAVGCSGLAVASPASAAVFDKHLAVNCPSPIARSAFKTPA